MSAIRLSSGRERAFIFRIKWVRCTFTVDFGDAYIGSNLLVQTTGRNPDHDFTLAGAERVEALPERLQGPLVLASGPIARETELNGFQQVLIAEWLGEKLDGPSFHRLHAHRNVAVRRDEDDWQLPARGCKVALQFEAASSRHPHIEY